MVLAMTFRSCGHLSIYVKLKKKNNRNKIIKNQNSQKYIKYNQISSIKFKQICT